MKQFYTPEELAICLGFGKQTIYNKISNKKDLPPITYVFGKPRFLIRDVDMWIKIKVDSAVVQREGNTPYK